METDSKKDISSSPVSEFGTSDVEKVLQSDFACFSFRELLADLTRRGLAFRETGRLFAKRLQRVPRLIRTVRNWPLVSLDKAGIVSMARYRLRNGCEFECRGRSSDINEVVAVCSGAEYPQWAVSGLRHNAVVIDVGANIGSFCMYITSLNPGICLRGLAVEPFTANVALLHRNLALNGIRSFEIVEAALSGTDGAVWLDTDRPFDRVVVSSAPTGKRVDAIRLSSLCRKRGIEDVDILKLDIEGYEYEILEGDIDFIRKNVRRIIVEWHRTKDGRDKRTICDLLGEGFNVRVVRDKPRSGVLVFDRFQN